MKSEIRIVDPTTGEVILDKGCRITKPKINRLVNFRDFNHKQAMHYLDEQDYSLANTCIDIARTINMTLESLEA